MKVIKTVRERMNLQQRRSFIISFTYFTIITLVCYLFLTHLIPMLAPFLAALAIAAFLEPWVDFLSHHIKGGRTLAAPLSLLSFYGCICGFLFLSGGQLLSLIQEQGKKLPHLYSQMLEPGLTRFFLLAEQSFPGRSLIISSFSQSLTGFIEHGITALSGHLLNWAASLMAAFPSFLLNCLAAVIASFFLTGNYRPVIDFFLRQLPEETCTLLKAVWFSVREVTGRLLKAYALLMLLTFAQLWIGFRVLGIPMRGTLAALVTGVDILPVLGTGTVLLPWAFMSWVTGNPSLGFGLFSLYLLITIVRQTLEPKLIGLQMGLSPVAALLCMFAGGKLMGLAGIFLFPIAATVAKELNDRGIIHILR